MIASYDKLNINRLKSARTIVFLAALFLYVLTASFDYTMFGTMLFYHKLSDAVKIIAMILLIIDALINIRSYTIKQLIVFGIMGAVAILCRLSYPSMAPILLLMFWVSYFETEYEEIAVIYLIANGICLIITLISCAASLIPDRVYMGNCHSLGFGYSNVFGMMQLSIILTYMAIRNNKLTIKEYAVIIALTLLVFLGCKSKGAFYASVIAIALNWIIDKSVIKNEKIVSIIAVGAYPLLTAISFFTALCIDYDNPFLGKMNSVLNGRLALGKNALSQYAIPAFGQNIRWIGNDEYALVRPAETYNYVDSSYLYIPLNYGWVFAVLILVLLTMLTYKACKEKKWNLVLVLIVMGIHGFVEGSILTIPINSSIIAVGMLFNSDNCCSKPELDIGELMQKVKTRWKAALSICIFVIVAVCILGFKSGQLYCNGIVESAYSNKTVEFLLYLIIGVLMGTVIGIASVTVYCIVKDHGIKK